MNYFENILASDKDAQYLFDSIFNMVRPLLPGKAVGADFMARNSLATKLADSMWGKLPEGKPSYAVFLRQICEKLAQDANKYVRS